MWVFRLGVVRVQVQGRAGSAASSRNQWGPFEAERKSGRAILGGRGVILCGVGVAERAALCTKELEDGGGQRSVRACDWAF
jgi:hypothetical protein